MSRTKRNASRWMETRFKLGDTQYPKDNEFLYFNGRYQAKMRNGNRNYYSMKIDPLSYKVTSWRECGNWAKPLAKRAARHNAKILVRLEAFTIMDEIWQDEQALMWEDFDQYEDNYMSYSYEALDYAEQRRLEEIQDEYEQEMWWSTYDPYMDWEY